MPRSDMRMKRGRRPETTIVFIGVKHVILLKSLVVLKKIRYRLIFELAKISSNHAMSRELELKTIAGHVITYVCLDHVKFHL